MADFSTLNRNNHFNGRINRRRNFPFSDLGHWPLFIHLLYAICAIVVDKLFRKSLFFDGSFECGEKHGQHTIFRRRRQSFYPIKCTNKFSISSSPHRHYLHIEYPVRRKRSLVEKKFQLSFALQWSNRKLDEENMSAREDFVRVRKHTF